jgi:hypothetical protein
MATENGLWAPVDNMAFRKGVERVLKKSRASLTQPVSPIQANLLVMQAKDISYAKWTMPDTLYDTKDIGTHKKLGR